MKIENLQEPEQPEIYVLIGVPASGKSTWTKRKLANSNKEFVVVSSDAHIERLGAAEGLNYSQAFDKYVGQATARMKQDFNEAIKTGKSIIWDQTNMSQKKRRGILQQVPQNYKKIAVDFDVPDKEIERRLREREAKTGKHIPPHIMKSMYTSYQAPTKAEGFDTIMRV